jgi:hypothetical protein
MIYAAPYVMLLMRGQVGVGWVLEIETFLGPVKWHRAVRRVPFGAQKVDITGGGRVQCSTFFLPHCSAVAMANAVNLNHKTY